jgi:hypothetical protein
MKGPLCAWSCKPSMYLCITLTEIPAMLEFNSIGKDRLCGGDYKCELGYHEGSSVHNGRSDPAP